MTTTTAAALDPTRLIIAALAGLVILLLLIIKFKVQAMISILVGAVAIGLIAGMPFTDIISSVNEGIGSTLKGIALLVGLGSMFGSILEISGGAQTLAVTMVKKFGDKKAAWALGITGLVIAMPVFFDAGLIILIPLAFSLAKRTKRSSLFYAIPLLAGLAVGHAFIPPTPGPVLVATMLGVDLGWVIMVGIVCGIFAMIVAGPIWGTICGNKYDIPVPEHIANQEDFDESKLPKFGTIVGIILIPLVLIILNSIAKVVPALASVQPVLGFLGEPFVALTIATVVAMFLLGYRHGYSPDELSNIIIRSAGILDQPITPEGAYELAKCSRGTPRVANRFLKRVRDFATVLGDGIIDRDVALLSLKRMDVDALGLDELDRSLLRAIIEMYNGGPVGLETLAAALGEEAVTLEDLCEPYLMQMGFLTRTPRGRCATRLAYEHLGLKAPESGSAEDNGQQSLF